MFPCVSGPCRINSREFDRSPTVPAAKRRNRRRRSNKRNNRRRRRRIMLKLLESCTPICDMCLPAPSINVPWWACHLLPLGLQPLFCTQRTSNLRAQSSTNIQKEKSVKAALLCLKNYVCVLLFNKNFTCTFFLSWNNIKKQQHAYNDDIMEETHGYGWRNQFWAVS